MAMLLMGKLTISMAIFNSYVKLPEGNNTIWLFNSLPWKITILIGTSSISMCHLYHGELLVITRW